MKVKLEFSVNQYSKPPKPYCCVWLGSTIVGSSAGETWQEAKEKALAKAKSALAFGDPPKNEEVEL